MRGILYYLYHINIHQGNITLLIQNEQLSTNVLVYV